MPWVHLHASENQNNRLSVQLGGVRHLLPLWLFASCRWFWLCCPEWRIYLWFFSKSKLTSEVNHQNDVSWKMLTLASAGLTQLILPWFGTDSVRLMSVSRAEWACAGFLFVPMCSGVFPVALSIIGIPASICWLLSFLLLVCICPSTSYFLWIDLNSAAFHPPSCRRSPRYPVTWTSLYGKTYFWNQNSGRNYWFWSYSKGRLLTGLDCLDCPGGHKVISTSACN